MYVEAAPLGEALQSLQDDQHSLSLYVERICARIKAVNPHVEALLPESGRRQRLLREAAELRRGESDGTSDKRHALLGAMVGVKDIFHVANFVTRCGSLVPPEYFAGPEAASVRQLRSAGALIVGKTVTTEFAYFEPGPTRNPHNLEHTPGGSSSGSAAAVAAGMCNLALGTQTIGSVIRPAAFCGIVGFKPTFDRIDTEGIVYFSRSIDHVGLFTQDILGMTAAAAVLCREWQPAEDLRTLPILGVPDGSYLAQTEQEALDKFEEQLLMLQVGGCEVKRVPALANIEALNALHRRLIFGEFAREHDKVFREHRDKYRQRTVEAIEIGQSVDDAELARTRKNILIVRQELEDLMAEHAIDLWICPPATGPAPAGIAATGDPNMNLPWTHAGMPVVTLPAGKADNGLPLGLQLVGRFGEDEKLLGWATNLSPLITEPIEE